MMSDTCRFFVSTWVKNIYVWKVVEQLRSTIHIPFINIQADHWNFWVINVPTQKYVDSWCMCYKNLSEKGDALVLFML